MMSAPYEPAVLQRAMASSESAGAACPRFLQNAWRQDLCSNCFRLRQDHAPALTNGKVGQVFSSSSKCSPHVTTVYQSATSWHSSSSSAQESYSSSSSTTTSHLLTTTSGVVPCGAAPAVPGILRSGGRRASTGSVGFLEAAPQVIGYGGVEAQEETGEEEEAVESSDDDDDDLGACDSLENYDLSVEEKAFAALTEKNTEFNAVIENLLAERHKEEQSRNSPEVVPSLAVPEAKTILAAEQPTRAPTEGSQFSLPRPWVRMMNGGRNSREGEAAEQPLPPPPSPDSETIDPPVQERVNGTSSPDPTLVPPPDYSVATQPTQQQQQQQQPLEMHYSSSAILKGLPMPYSSTSVLKGLPRPPPPTSPAPSTPSPAATPLLTPAAPSTPSPMGSPGTKPSPPKTKPKLPAKPLKLKCNAEGTSGSSSASSSPETTPKIEEEIKGKMSVAAETSADDGDTAYGMVYRREVTEIRTSNEYSEIRDANTVSPEISSGNDGEEQLQQEQDMEVESDDVDIELSFQAKVASIASHLDLSKRNPKRQAPPPPHSPLSPCSSIASSEPEQPASHGHNNSPPPTPTSPTAPRRVLPVSPPLVRKSSSKTGFFSPCAAASAPEGHQFLHHRESKKHRNKFSLKKLLKFGKDSDDGSAGRIKFGSATPANSVPERRPRPQILHPMDLANMAANQLANGTSSDCEASLLQNGSCETSSLESTGDMDKQTFSPNESPVPNDARVQLLSHVSLEQKNKPSPPPRAKGGPESPSQPKRPVRPPPPTLQSAVTDNFESIIFPSTQQDENFCSDAASPDGGEVRTVLVPKKPERGSPSTNPKETVVNPHFPVSQSNDLNEEPHEEQEIKDKEERTYYEPPEILDDIPPPVPLHNVQEASEMSTAYQVQSQVSVTTVEKVTRQERHARAAGVVFLDTNGGFGGSEESDTVSVSSSEVASSPASNGPRDLSHLYAEVVRKAKRERHAICLQVSPDDETTQVVCNGHSNNGCVKRASLRNGHSAIHRSLEENYNAVVAANHETLGQLLEQVLSIKTASSGCSRLKDSVLHWSDFAIEKSLPVKFGNTVMYNATWGPNVEVTLLVMPDPPLPPSSTKGPFILTPLATFHEFLPTCVLNPSSALENDNEPGLQRGTVWVFRKTEVTSLQDVGRELALLRTDDIVEFEHSVCLLMLQLITALKHLQAQGVEEVDGSLDWLAIVRSQDSLQSQLGDDVLTMPLQLVLLGGGASSFDQGNMTSVLSLCECGLEVMATLLCGDGERAELDISERLSCKRAFLGVAETLQKEKSTSLSRAKTILELVLWGPTPEQSLEDEKTLQRWLDLERATVLSELVTSRPLNRIDLSIMEEYRLLFLVRTNWRAIREAAAVIVSTTSTA